MRQPSAEKCTLREFFNQFYAPIFLVDAADKTVEAYRESIAHWVRVTEDLRLREIDSSAMAAFKARLRTPADDRRPLAVATVNKHLRHLHAVLGKAGPPGPRNRDAMAVLPRVPWTKPLKQKRRLPRNIDDETLNAIYRAADTAEYPVLPQILPAQWWRALLVTALTTGFRRAGLLGLRWDGIDPVAAEIRIDAEVDKCDADRCKPLHPIAWRHLEPIRNGRPLVFSWPHAAKTFYRQWHRIQAAAGLPAEKHIKLHDLKRACGTRLAKVGSAWVVQHMLDHGSITTSRHYVNASDESRDAVSRLALPESFVAPPPDDRQMRLF